MSDLFSKLSKAVDAFADVLTADVSSVKNAAIYKFSDLKSFVRQAKKEHPAVAMCRVSLTVQSEFNGKVFPEAKYIVRILLLEEAGQPICIGRPHDGYLGTVVIASSVDTKMNEFMKGKTERTVVVRGEE